MFLLRKCIYIAIVGFAEFTRDLEMACSELESCRKCPFLNQEIAIWMITAHTATHLYSLLSLVVCGFVEQQPGSELILSLERLKDDCDSVLMVINI